MVNDKYLCPACGEHGSSDIYSAHDYLVSGREYLIRKCNVCGMGWTVDPPPEIEAGGYYVSEEYISHSDRKKSLSDYLYHFARAFMLGKKARLVTSASGKTTGVLLDIGSGTGYFPGFMLKKGWSVTGIEISENARSFSSDRFGINALPPGELDKIPPASADCITFWHVLEHLYDPSLWLSEVKRIMRDDGKCIIALPNFSSSDSEWFGNRWAALDVPRHLWHFTPEAFRRFITRNGLICEKTVSLPLDLFYISSLSYRNAGRALPLFRGILTAIILAMRNIFRKEKASSLVYVLSKTSPGQY
jgi:SAM-dependent methyltransferase